jgi:hypothetical protein
MWEPLPPAPPLVGWWVELERADAVAWAEGRVAEQRARAERIDRLRARCHEVDMKAARALSADRWRKIQRRLDERHGVGRRSGRAAAWGADRGEIEYSTHDGRVVSVR